MITNKQEVLERLRRGELISKCKQTGYWIHNGSERQAIAPAAFNFISIRGLVRRVPDHYGIGSEVYELHAEVDNAVRAKQVEQSLRKQADTRIEQAKIVLGEYLDEFYPYLDGKEDEDPNDHVRAIARALRILRGE